MARKRTPPPPRRVQAPKTRREQRERRPLVLLVAAVLGVAIVAVAAFFLLRDGGSKEESVATAMRAAGCTFRAVDARPAGVHISNAAARPKEWNTFPPTSGPHHGQWVIWGEYEEPVSLAQAVHNLEHGGVVMYYGDDVPQAQIEELRRFYREDAVAMLLSPLPRLGNKIALTAWHAPVATAQLGTEKGAQGIIAQCMQFDEDAFERFRDEYRFQGPERIPADSLQPGT